jgi:hypothetical protein
MATAWLGMGAWDMSLPLRMWCCSLLGHVRLPSEVGRVKMFLPEGMLQLVGWQYTLEWSEYVVELVN